MKVYVEAPQYEDGPIRIFSSLERAKKILAPDFDVFWSRVTAPGMVNYWTTKTYKEAKASWFEMVIEEHEVL